VESIRQDSFWRDKVSVETAAEAGLEGRDDGDHLAHCRREGLILVTLDGDFMDDRRYPIAYQTPGIIQIVSTSEADIFRSLATLLLFILGMPFRQGFSMDAGEPGGGRDAWQGREDPRVEDAAP
jgi:predicted nuclease of predicted toxin-antitoxin system